MNGAAGDSSHIGPPKLLLPITPRTLDGISPSSGVESFEAEESHEDRTNTQIFGDERLEEQNNLEDKSRRRVDSSESWESESVSSSSSSSDIEEGQVSMSFEAAHEFREIRATKIVQHYGRIRVFRGPLGAVFYIGPHWYAVIVMASVIVGIGFGFSFWATPRLNMSEGKRWWQRFIGVLLTDLKPRSFKGFEDTFKRFNNQVRNMAILRGEATPPRKSERKVSFCASALQVPAQENLEQLKLSDLVLPMEACSIDEFGQPGADPVDGELYTIFELGKTTLKEYLKQ
ncbi:hypothetical protein FOL47_007913, partial [Perkinsus chesapeaki]